ncbi:MmgE/PrpD family protein [Roseitranquillus sediminis]|uniref:MmgE/PrpD family protein n=1 Tax=Roseitranquillus sediminis TaxID=2809051 RepID=UPI001D0CAA60|nr:MmgE/PrpD family protein [Roseitranquillus sediminis]MBM9594716.1 MmgE/PrpD family protein [Roseitranquillus sediminis]
MVFQITQALGRFVATAAENEMPDRALETARLGFSDCIGVMYAGRNEEAPNLLAGVLAPNPGSASLVLGHGRTAAAPEAAWINGVAAHALDFDDVGVGGHPSTVIVPAILAEAEHLDLSGSEMLRAYVVGYEAWAELSLREPGSLHGKGWHPTGIWGAIAASAACARLRGLDERRATMAVALGASMSAGIMANFGTMTKPYHAGRAAHAGVMAARLAEAGFSSSPDAIEHPQGLLSAVSPRGEADKERDSTIGQVWQIVERGLNIKKFPACYCTHRAIDALIDLRAEKGIEPEKVDRITVSISDRFATILRNHQPQTGLEAKFSMEFAMASAAIRGRVSLMELTDDFVTQPDVQDLMSRVDLDLTQNYDPDHPNAALFDQVMVRLKDGDELKSAEVRYARGHAREPLTERDLQAKFSACIEYGGAEHEAQGLFDRLMALEDLSARELLAGHRAARVVA